LLSAALLAGVAPAQSGSGTHAVVVHADKKIGTINPNIYGHFAEHLGHCVEEGIWVGPDSEIPNVRGIRTDVVEALKKIKPPVIRWPGGCFADSYHWQDGIGPREDRPKRINVHWGRVIENNHFGTHEFIDFCRQVGAEPMIAANVGSGTPQEMRDWLEYLNVGADSTLANLRAKNGHPEPFNVRYVCIGNENWGCGGSMDPSHYALLYRQFSEYCHFPPKEVANSLRRWSAKRPKGGIASAGWRPSTCTITPGAGITAPRRSTGSMNGMGCWRRGSGLRRSR
jgi:alpha-L-arabinofuranosidase